MLAFNQNVDKTKKKELDACFDQYKIADWVIKEGCSRFLWKRKLHFSGMWLQRFRLFMFMTLTQPGKSTWIFLESWSEDDI